MLPYAAMICCFWRDHPAVLPDVAHPAKPWKCAAILYERRHKLDCNYERNLSVDKRECNSDVIERDLGR